MSKKKESDLSAIRRILPDLYDFRFNTIKQKAEYRKTNTTDEFHPVDKVELNSLRLELNELGVEVSTADIKCFLESRAVKNINPIIDYFEELPEYDPVKHGNPIRDLCATVKIINNDKWEWYFTHWIVGVVANALDQDYCRNHLCLVLSGPQGTFKTSWLENLTPKRLRRYSYCGKLNMDNGAKDVLTLAAENLFINIDDQLKVLNRKDEDALKNLITANQVKYRRPYDPYICEYPKLASWCASVNGLDFLTDPTGSRRFLPFEIEKTDIQTAQRIDMDLVFAQALKMYRENYKYWLDEKEIDELNNTNQRFAVVSIEMELVTEYFKLEPVNQYDSPSYLTCSAIKSILESKTGQRLSIKLLGQALKKAGFQQKQLRLGNSDIRKWVYEVFEVEYEDLKQARKKVTLIETL